MISSKRGDISINLIVAVIIAVIVLVVVALFFSGYFGKSTQTVGTYSQSDKEAAVAACQVACNSARYAADCNAWAAMYCEKSVNLGGTKITCKDAVVKEKLSGAACDVWIGGVNCKCVGQVIGTKDYKCIADSYQYGDASQFTGYRNYRWKEVVNGQLSGQEFRGEPPCTGTWGCGSKTCDSAQRDYQCTCTLTAS